MTDNKLEKIEGHIATYIVEKIDIDFVLSTFKEIGKFEKEEIGLCSYSIGNEQQIYLNKRLTFLEKQNKYYLLEEIVYFGTDRKVNLYTLEILFREIENSHLSLIIANNRDIFLKDIRILNVVLETERCKLYGNL